MNNRNLLLKIIKFALIVGSPFMGNRLLAEDLKVCPENLPKVGVDLRILDNNQSVVTITKSIAIKNASNNESLRTYIALLKLNAVESYSRFIKSERTSISTKYGGKRYIEKYDTSWDFMKKSIASMEEKYLCIKKGSKKDAIFFTGEWTPKSRDIADRIIAYREARREVRALRREDPKFNYKELVKKYPNIFSNEDPKIILKAIDEWKKYRRF